MQRQARFVIFILGGWFCFALAAGVSGRFRNFSAPQVALTLWILTALELLGCWTIKSAREWWSNVDLRALIVLHLSRFVGIYFVLLGARGELPQGFAKPAGLGDILIAVGAALIIIFPRLDRRRFLSIWNTLGLIDIVFVAFSALRFGLRDLPSMAPLRELPLSLLPTFLVPLIITSHVIIFLRLRRKR